MLSIFNKQLSEQSSNYIGDGVYNLCSMLTSIKNKYNPYNKVNQPNINLSFTILHKNDTKGTIDQEYGNNITHNTFSNGLGTTSINLLDKPTIKEEILSQDNNNCYDVTTQQYDTNNITLHSEEISYEMAYSLLLDLVNNDIELLEEVLLIAKILIKEGVLVAPESKIKKDIAQIVLHNISKQTTQNSGYSR